MDDKIAIFGIGKMGLPLACAFAEKGFEVTGIDINEDLVKRINGKQDVLPNEPGVFEIIKSTKNFKATGNPDVSNQDYVIILVPTLIHETKKGIEPDLSIAIEVAEKIGKTLKKGAIVITECTMPPGATEKIGAAIEKTSGLKIGDFGLAHCPERTSSGVALRDIRGQYPKIIGASDNAALEKVAKIYEKINSKGVIRMPSIRAAEAVKVFEGIYRDVNIALANELAKYCEKIGVDAIEVFKAANTQPYSHIHMPSCGVGGHCIPYYPYFVMSEETPLIKAARKTNDSMPEHAVNLLNPTKGTKIAMLGLTFRGGVKEFRKSPALDIIKILKSRGIEVYAIDPLCTDKEIESFDAKPLKDYAVDGIIIATNHKEFKSLDWQKIIKQMRTKVILDGCQCLEPKTIRDLGAKYIGVGRL